MGLVLFVNNDSCTVPRPAWVDGLANGHVETSKICRLEDDEWGLVVSAKQFMDSIVVDNETVVRNVSNVTRLSEPQTICVYTATHFQVDPMLVLRETEHSSMVNDTLLLYKSSKLCELESYKYYVYKSFFDDDFVQGAIELVDVHWNGTLQQYEAKYVLTSYAVAHYHAFTTTNQTLDEYEHPVVSVEYNGTSDERRLSELTVEPCLCIATPVLAVGPCIRAQMRVDLCNPLCQQFTSRSGRR